MDTKEKEAFIKEMTEICDEYATLSLQCKILETKLQVLCPIKLGDKIEIINAETDEHIRFAYFRSIEIGYSQGTGRGFPVFKLDKCTKQGTRSSHSDYLRYKEAIKRIP